MSQSAQFPSAEPGGIRLVDPLTQPGWDEAVATLPGAGVFHGAAWAGVLQDSYGYRPCFLAEYREGRLRAVLPLIEVDSWITGRRGVSLPFADAVEALCPDAASFQGLHAAALELGRERRWRYLELRGGLSWLPETPPSITYFRHRLRLTGSEEALFAGLDDSTRRAVRKAERSGLRVDFSQDFAAVSAYYGLHCRTRRRHGVPPQPFSFFARLHARMIARDLGMVALARRGDAVLAGAVFLHRGTDALFKFGADDGEQRQLRPANIVLWRAIQHYLGRGCTVLDLGRTSVGQDGLRRYKLGWGPDEERLGYIRHDIRRSVPMTVRDEATAWHAHLFRLLPGPLFRLAGRCLYPHLG